MIKKFAISSIIAAGLLLACSDVTDSRTDPLSPTASVSVSVIDAVTGAPINGAEVSVLTLNNGRRSTDAAGRTYYDDVMFGNYEVVVSKPGYVGIKATTTVTQPSATGVGTATEISQSQALVQSYYIAGNAAWTVTLPPKTGSIDGTVLYNTDAFNTNQAPAAGAKVRADLPAVSNLIEQQFETTADENGYFRFDNLPAGTASAYTITVLNYETDNAIFYATPAITPSVTIPKANSNNPVSTGTTVLTTRARTSDFRLVSYTRTVTGSDKIVFTFSDEIDASLILRNNIAVPVSATSAIDVEWKGNELIITPNSPWNTSNNTMQVTFSGGAALTACGVPGSCLTSVKGQTLQTAPTNPTINILPPDISDKVVTGLDKVYYDFSTNPATTDSLNWNSTRYRLRWNSLPGATEYQVYIRYSKNLSTSKAWVAGPIINTAVKGGIPDTTVGVPTAQLISAIGGVPALYEGDVAEFVVIGRNSMYQSKFEGARIYTMRDELGPKMSSDASLAYDLSSNNIYVWNTTYLKQVDGNDATGDTVQSYSYGLANRGKADTICINGGYKTQDPPMANAGYDWNESSWNSSGKKLGLTFDEPIDTSKVAPPPPAIHSSGRRVTPFFIWGDNTNAGNSTANLCYVVSAGSEIASFEHVFAFQLVDKAGHNQRFQRAGNGRWRDSVYVYVRH
ncbi:MAG: carboxypeptidase-like regulatory domain-containing protein [Fibromonadales bacterium]|nr:carboxypeptidase-like regulatory domain-containing protein [Fibromonadales bacterium]